MRIYHLEIHAADGCNLNCESCSHLSGPHHKGILSPEEADFQFGLWSPRLSISKLIILGGEPALNPNLTDIVQLARKHFPCSEVKIVSNGFLLYRHHLLPETLLKTKTSIRISLHSNQSQYEKTFFPVRKLIKHWQSLGIDTEILPSEPNWTRRYHGSGSYIKPFEDNSPHASWESCHGKRCRQLRNGYIWKCPLLAYLPLQAALFPELIPTWKLGLDYKPLHPTATEEEMIEFFGRQEEPQCGLCPVNPQKFRRSIIKPSLEKSDEM